MFPEAPVLQKWLPFWSALDATRRAVILGATVAVFVAVLALARFGAAPTMTLLYAGLDPAAAGEVVAALDQRGVAYEVRGDSIFVDAAARDALRMSLAGEGLPAIGGAGYELLDRLSGFGTTAQMFDAAVLRAKEGELARTIAAGSAFRAARVHIAVPQGSPFRRDTVPTASVTVTARAGAVTAEQARALRHLVAASVAGLDPARVAVIDTTTGLTLAADDAATPQRSGDDRAAAIRASVERLLSARVGPGRALVEVAVEIETERESVTERRLDPQGRVAVLTETDEQSESAQGTTPGVTVASNLPEGDAGSGEQRSSSTQTRERVSFEVSETSRSVERPPGAIRRLSVAVLVDGTRDAAGAWAPRPEAELADLRELVAAAAGVDLARGDTITIKSLQFEAPPEAGTLAAPGLLDRLDLTRLLQGALIAAVALVLGLFVLRPVLAGSRPPAGPAGLPALALPSAGAAIPVLEGEIAGPGAPPLSARTVSQPEAARMAADPVERLRRLIAERQSESVEILRNWMEDQEERR
jgi:flagellar M-ring protein FliF